MTEMIKAPLPAWLLGPEGDTPELRAKLDAFVKAVSKATCAVCGEFIEHEEIVRELARCAEIVEEEVRPSLPASGHGEVAGLVEELRADRDQWRDLARLERERGDAAEARAESLRLALIAEKDTPSPVEARADGVRVKALKEAAQIAWQFAAKAVPPDGPRTMARLIAAEITKLASLESTPAQPVREGQEGKAEPVAWQWRMRDAVTGEPSEWRDGRHGMSEVYVRDWKIEERPLFASQPDPAAEIAEATDLSDLKARLLKRQRDHLYETNRVVMVDPDDTNLLLDAAIAVARAERAESELASRVTEAHEHLMVEALAEIKASVDGQSDQPVKDIVYGLLEEIAALANTADRGQEEKGNG